MPSGFEKTKKMFGDELLKPNKPYPIGDLGSKRKKVLVTKLVLIDVIEIMYKFVNNKRICIYVYIIRYVCWPCLPRQGYLLCLDSLESIVASLRDFGP
jgi:hypothetical protein